MVVRWHFVHPKRCPLPGKFIVVVRTKGGHMKTFVATLIAFLFVCESIVSSNAAWIADLKAAVEGVYILDEWIIDEQTFRPPAIEGRSVIFNGNIITILIDTTQESKKTYNTIIGEYPLSTDSFIYHYNYRTGFTQSSDSISLSRALPFDGNPREFSVKQEGNTVHLQHEDKAAFDFNADGQIYSEAGKVLRVWHRAKPSE
jgi:hypothetical protein